MANANQIIPRSQQHGTMETKPRHRQQCGQLISRNCENSCQVQSHKMTMNNNGPFIQIMALQQISQNLQCTEIWLGFANQWVSDETCCTHVMRLRNKSWNDKLQSSYPAQLSFFWGFCDLFKWVSSFTNRSKSIFNKYGLRLGYYPSSWTFHTHTHTHYS